ISQGAGRASVAAYDCLATARGCDGGVSTPQRSEGDRKGPDLPSARRYGARYTRVAQDATGQRAARDAERRDQRPPDVERGRSSRRVEGEEVGLLENNNYGFLIVAFASFPVLVSALCALLALRLM